MSDDEDSRPTWTWTNSLTCPTTIRVEPSFKPELGLVFVGIGKWADGRWACPDHNGIWLDRERLVELSRALRTCATWAELNADDDL